MPNHKHLSIKQPLLFRPQAYRHFTLGLFSFLCAYLAASTFAPVKISDAQELQYDINSETGFYVRVTGSSTLSVADVTSTSIGQLASVKDTINVETNSPFGYRLTFSSATANLVNTTDSNLGFTPTSGTITTPIALQKDTWGFAFNKDDTGVVDNGFADSSKYTSASTPSVPDSTATWAAVPTTPTQLSSQEDANISTDGTDLDIYYGINASIDLPTGTYATTITYTAYSEGANDKMPTMQDFTQAQCDALTTDVPIKLIDTRDLKTYSVTKLRDGNCWMTSNLALDGGRTLTPSDSNVVTNHTLPANITDDASSTYDSPQIYSGSTNGVIDSSFANSTDNKGNKYGNLYNWNAATATVGLQSTTGTVYESVCPKGWRLPDNGIANGTKTYALLLAAYNIPTDTTSDASAYISQLQQPPVSIAITNDNAMSNNVTALYTRTTTEYANIAYELSMTNNNTLFPQGRQLKNIRRSLRCVYGEDSTNLMQNFTAAQCNALTVSTASTPVKKVLMDSRDGKLYNISRLADNPSGTNNGICWMVSNLALDGADSQGTVRTLTTADSNVTADRPLAPNITNGTTSVYDDPQIYSGNANSATTSCNSSYPYCIANSENLYGNLYNWNAATATVGKQATTSTVTESVCPKGWQLPNNTGTRSFNNLMSAYSLPTTNVTNGAAVQKIQQTPLNFPSAGYYHYSSLMQTYDARYWSRTAYANDTYCAYHLHFSSENGLFRPQNDSIKADGFSIRCLLNS